MVEKNELGLSGELKGNLRLAWDVIYLSAYTVFVVLRRTFKFFVPDPPKNLEDEIILVTGGGSGIGREICLNLAQQEKNLTIISWDVNESGNLITMKQLKALGVRRAVAFHVNVADRHQVAAAGKKIREEIGDVSVLFNNAGVLGDCKMGWEQDCATMEKVIGVNVLGQCWTLREFLPKMIENRKGHVVQTASILALQHSSLTSTYVASKHAVKGYMESIREDIRMLGVEGVHISLAYPFSTATDMMAPYNGTSGCKYPFLRVSMTPSFVAERIVRGMRQNEEHIYIPEFVKIFSTLAALYPVEVVRKAHDLSGSSGTFCRKTTMNKITQFRKEKNESG